jgi:excisionase family DNA binding protein
MRQNGSVHPQPDLSRRLNDLLERTGPPLTTAELANLIGMSSTFVRKEICNGYLRAVPVGRGRKRVFRIPVREARRYVRALGLL